MPVWSNCLPFKLVMKKFYNGFTRVLVVRLRPLWALTHSGPVTHICVSIITIIGSDNGLLPCRCQALSEPVLEIVNWAIGKKLKWKCNRGVCIFILENEFENVVWKMAAILSQSQFVKIRVVWCAKPAVTIFSVLWCNSTSYLNLDIYSTIAELVPWINLTNGEATLLQVRWNQTTCPSVATV